MGIFTSRHGAEDFVRLDPFVTHAIVAEWDDSRVEGASLAGSSSQSHARGLSSPSDPAQGCCLGSLASLGINSTGDEWDEEMRV